MTIKDLLLTEYEKRLKDMDKKLKEKMEELEKLPSRFQEKIESCDAVLEEANDKIKEMQTTPGQTQPIEKGLEDAPKLQSKEVDILSKMEMGAKLLNLHKLAQNARTEELELAHTILHNWEQSQRQAGSFVGDWDLESLWKAHTIIAQELEKRQISHDSKMKIPESLQAYRPIRLKGFLENLPEEIKIGEFVYVVGGLVNRGACAQNDVDICLRNDWPIPVMQERIKELLGKTSERFHWVYSGPGPLIGLNVPIYELKLVRISHDIQYLQRELKPFRPFTPMKSATGYRKNEFFDIGNAWRFWAAGFAKEGVFVQMKADGIRLVVHKTPERVAIYTEDKKRDRAGILPQVVAEAKKIPGSWIIDTEAVWYKAGEPIPREDMLAIVSGKTPLTGEDIRMLSHDLVWLNGKDLTDLGYDKRLSLLKRLVGHKRRYFKPMDAVLVHDQASFKKAFQRVARIPGSEGAMLKSKDSKYDITGKRTHAWAKVKIVYEIDAQVTKVIKKKVTKGPRAGKWTGAYIYEGAILAGDGKTLIPIGTTYATGTKAKIGDIITVRPVRIEVKRQPELPGGFKITWMFPIFKNIHLAKKKPDTIATAIKIARKSGEVKLTQDLQKILFLKDCPFVNNSETCPLHDRFEHLMLKQELSFPIECPAADKFKCPYVKDYYFKMREVKE